MNDESNTEKQGPDKSYVPIHGPEVGAAPLTELSDDDEKLLGVTSEYLRAPEAGTFAPGDSLVVLQVNARDIRNSDDGEIGQLYPEQAAAVHDKAEDFFTDLFEGIDHDERDKVKILVIASDARLKTPTDESTGQVGLSGDIMRAKDTAVQVVEAARGVLTKNGLSEEQLILSIEDTPLEFGLLKDVNMLHDTDNPNSVAFLNFLIEKYGIKTMWAVYEGDEEKEVREKYGVEGPSDIAKRVAQSVDIASDLADAYLGEHPDHRVVVWAVGHYDNLSHYIKEHVLGLDPAKAWLPMDKGSGIVLHRSAQDGKTTTSVEGEQREVR